MKIFIDWSTAQTGYARNGIEKSAAGHDLDFAQAKAFFYDRIEDVLPPDVISITRLLGHAIAHEAGHALLETTEHSLTGLMKSRWDKADFRRAGRGLLEFTPAETRILREHARLRLARLVAKRELVANREPNPPSAAPRLQFSRVIAAIPIEGEWTPSVQARYLSGRVLVLLGVSSAGSVLVLDEAIGTI